jgi:transcriptional regulator with XRE-family HTH domain
MLRERRELLGLTLEEMGHKMNVSKMCISQWERGIRFVNVQDLIKLKECYSLSDKQLIEYLKSIARK